MKRILLLIVAVICLSASAQKNIYGFYALDAKERDVSMSAYKGKVILIVNTATKCGFTPQYTELQDLYEKYKDRGLVILDFPCNQFGNQAPGSMKEIQNFCSANFNVTFPQFSKVLVNGEGETPLFTYLKKKQKFKGFDTSNQTGAFMDDMLRKQDPDYDRKSDIKWNFTKFLVNSKGKPVKRFEPTAPISEVEAAIVRELAKVVVSAIK